MTVHFQYDFFVIGAGSGGVRASRIAASFGARVAVAEMGPLGGTCVNVGCIPKKLLVYASEFSRDAADARGYGWTVGEVRNDWASLIEHKNREIGRLNGVYETLLERAGVTLIRGRATLDGPNAVQVDGRSFSARYVLIATGGTPTVPEGRGYELGITSNDAFVLKAMPKRIAVVGGGYIAVEFAGIFHGLGAEVTLIHRRDQVLRGFDEDVRRHLTDELRGQGIALKMPAHIERVRRVANGLEVELDDQSRELYDQVMFATGRKPLTHDLGLQAAGIALDAAGAVVVDEFSRTSVPSVYAVGDATNRVNLTPVAIHEGTAVAQTLFNNTPTRADHRDVPSAVFSQPTVATVGLTEAEARARYGAVTIYRSQFRELKHTLSGRKQQAYMKLVVETQSDRVVGLHMVGDHAGEVVQGFAVAIKMGATKAQFDATLGIHPTAAEEFVTMRTPHR